VLPACFSELRKGVFAAVVAFRRLSTLKRRLRAAFLLSASAVLSPHSPHAKRAHKKMTGGLAPTRHFPSVATSLGTSNKSVMMYRP
jgi:hypothetical protein